MRRLLWAFTALLALLLAGCSENGDKLVFFYDRDFGQVAEYTPALFLGEEKPFFKEISGIALESGYAFRKRIISMLSGADLTIPGSRLL